MSEMKHPRRKECGLCLLTIPCCQGIVYNLYVHQPLHLPQPSECTPVMSSHIVLVGRLHLRRGQNALSQTTELGGRERIWSQACVILSTKSPGILGKCPSSPWHVALRFDSCRQQICTVLPVQIYHCFLWPREGRERSTLTSTLSPKLDKE